MTEETATQVMRCPHGGMCVFKTRVRRCDVKNVLLAVTPSGSQFPNQEVTLQGKGANMLMRKPF